MPVSRETSRTDSVVARYAGNKRLTLHEFDAAGDGIMIHCAKIDGYPVVDQKGSHVRWLEPGPGVIAGKLRSMDYVFEAIDEALKSDPGDYRDPWG